MKDKIQEGYATIEILSKDRTGLVSEITGIMSDLNITILQHNARVYNHRHKGMVSDFKVHVKADSPEQIELLIRRLSKIKGVISVQ